MQEEDSEPCSENMLNWPLYHYVRTRNCRLSRLPRDILIDIIELTNELSLPALVCAICPILEYHCLCIKPSSREQIAMWMESLGHPCSRRLPRYHSNNNAPGIQTLPLELRLMILRCLALEDKINYLIATLWAHAIGGW
jgi:hypothetical protein